MDFALTVAEAVMIGLATAVTCTFVGALAIGWGIEHTRRKDR